MVNHRPYTDQPLRERSAGFTLIELLVVLSIIAVLLTLSVPRYFQSIDTAKEKVLAENLQVTRDTINKFYGDTGRYPESLEELVEKKYLRSLPFDPVSELDFTIVPPDDGRKGKVYDIKTKAIGRAHSGILFSQF